MVFRRFVNLVVCLTLAVGANAQTFTNEHFRLQVPPAPDVLIANVALADYNGDGRLDMYHAGRLYRQEEDGSFSEVLSRANITLEGNEVQGAVFGDANLDGRLDLLIFDSFPGSRFYLNRSGEKFDLASSTSIFYFRTGLVELSGEISIATAGSTLLSRVITAIIRCLWALRRIPTQILPYWCCLRPLLPRAGWRRQITIETGIRTFSVPIVELATT